MDECKLTLKDISKVKRRFAYILTGIFHKRIEYPESNTKGRSQRSENATPKTSISKNLHTRVLGRYHRQMTMEITIRNNQRLVKINHQKVEKVLKNALKAIESDGSITTAKNKEEKDSHLELSVLFVNDREMRGLNLQYRDIHKTTDVLSFPLISENWELRGEKLRSLGDIVINLHQVERQASKYGATFYDEVTRLLVHGLLHLLGYDHEKNRYQARKMKIMEEEIIKKIGQRTEDPL
ncbi:rRNA maturation RNase YbeY [Thermodesulfovibrionales bacterium]|nr:rRNA maturation RNase YbeY [Thermodesulfovibrionales bacterium]